MRLFFIKLVVALSLGVATLAHAALPPEMEADRQLLAAQSAISAGDWNKAVSAFEAFEAIGIGKKKPAGYDFLYGNALARAGQGERGKALLEKYLADTGTTGKYYRDALEALTFIEDDQKNLQITLVAEQERQLAQKKIDDAWLKSKTKWHQEPASGASCADITRRIKAQSGSARKISCNCRVEEIDHPAHRDHLWDVCEATWEGNVEIDGVDDYEVSDRYRNPNDNDDSWHYETETIGWAKSG